MLSIGARTRRLSPSKDLHVRAFLTIPLVIYMTDKIPQVCDNLSNLTESAAAKVRAGLLAKEIKRQRFAKN